MHRPQLMYKLTSRGSYTKLPEAKTLVYIYCLSVFFIGLKPRKKRKLRNHKITRTRNTAYKYAPSHDTFHLKEKIVILSPRLSASLSPNDSDLYSRSPVSSHTDSFQASILVTLTRSDLKFKEVYFNLEPQSFIQISDSYSGPVQHWNI